MSTVTARTCPSCNATLEVVSHEGVDVDRCPEGHGVWLDKGELRAVVLNEELDRPSEEELEALLAGARDHGQALLDQVKRGQRDCPVCSRPMLITEYARSGVAIDECGNHGVWLDEGELQGIEAYAEALRTQARGGPAGTIAHTAVSGLNVPADLLATIRTANVPPPG